MNNEYKFIKACRVPAGWIKHKVITAGNVESQHKYFDIRVGLTWPENENPVQACMVGEAWFDRPIYATDRGEMCLIWECEHDGLSVTKFLDKVTGVFQLYWPTVIYADLTQEDYQGSFNDYGDTRHLTRIRLQQAPSADDFI